MRKNHLVLLVLLMISCNRNSQTLFIAEDGTQVLKMDLRKQPSSKEAEAFINRLSSVRLHPLETVDESIFSANRITISGDRIWAVDHSQYAIFSFQRDGSFINKIEKRGQGPEEYSILWDIEPFKDSLYVLDANRVQVYDFMGNYGHSIPVENGRQLLITSDGNIAITGTITDDYLLKVYDPEKGEKVNYFPEREKFSDIQFVRPAAYTLGAYDGGIYFCQYYDHTIYYLKNNEVKPLYRFDLGEDKIPESIFNAPTEQKSMDLELQKDKMVVSLVNLTITDDWLIFCPEKWFAPMAVYYNMKEDIYMTNKNLPFPYSVLLGEYQIPRGYENGEFYLLVTSEKLKEILLQLQEKGTLSSYDFLKDIDPDQIGEDDNPWVLYYKLI